MSDHRFLNIIKRIENNKNRRDNIRERENNVVDRFDKQRYKMEPSDFIFIESTLTHQENLLFAEEKNCTELEKFATILELKP